MIDCKHEPLGGESLGLLWHPEALFEDEEHDGEVRVGTAVCRLCGCVFAGLFGVRAIPTPADGGLEYRGPYKPQPERPKPEAT